MIDYTIFYRKELPADGAWVDVPRWDIFISSFNSSERVNKVYDWVDADQKHWLMQPDYDYRPDEYPNGDVFGNTSANEAEFFQDYFDKVGVDLFDGKQICIDITGFIKPYMMHLIFCFKRMGVKKLDIIYSEPDRYAKKEETIFSDELVYQIRQVVGFAGIHAPDTSNDLLVIGSGYDDELIAQVAENKNHCRKLQMFGLPSLRPDMYQENILNAYKASEAIGVGIRNMPSTYFAPANDPFAVATELSALVCKENERKQLSNIYLCPLATKPQALGFTLFYLTECYDMSISMIYPFCHTHTRETSKGISRISKYTIEFAG